MGDPLSVRRLVCTCWLAHASSQAHRGWAQGALPSPYPRPPAWPRPPRRYVNTPAYAGHERDPHRRQQREAAARQDAVRAVVKLQARLAPENKLLEKRAPGAQGEGEAEAEAEAAPSEAAGAMEAVAAAAANPFLAPTLWENRLGAASVSELPEAAAAAASAGPTGAGGEAPAAEAARAAADLAGESAASSWQAAATTGAGGSAV